MVRKFLLTLIGFYQKTVSPDHGFLARNGAGGYARCVFYPSCSQYAKEAMEKYGAKKGALLAIRRVLRCHPWQKNHIDPLV